MNKKQILEMLGNVKSGKITVDQITEKLNSTRGMVKANENFSCKDMREGKAYFVENGKIVSLPLSKKRNDGRIATFVPYYRTESTV